MDSKDQNLPWWQGKKDFYNVAPFSLLWAQGAMSEIALGGGPHLIDDGKAGTATKPFAELEKAVVELGGRKVICAPSNGSHERAFFVWDNAALAMWWNDDDIDMRYATNSPEMSVKLKALLDSSMGPKISSGRAYVMIATQEGIKLQSIGQTAVPLEKDNYNTEILKDFDAVVADLNSDTPSGRLAIFDGPPGTGKTFMVRGLIDAVPNALFVLVPVGLVPELAGPGMVSALLATRAGRLDSDAPTVFIVEDADDCLGTRDAGNVNAVSALLNLGDGIIGSALDLRLVCTTNLKNEELDPAVVRPGRLSRKIHLGKLDAEVATKLYMKLAHNSDKKPVEVLGSNGVPDDINRGHATLADVYMHARHAGWKGAPKKKAVGFGDDDDLDY